MKNELVGLKYIDIRNGLDLEDYYRTDLHWKQENLQDVVKIIQNGIGLDIIEVNYDMENKGEFCGAYYGQLATNVPPDNIYVLSNETIQNCTTYNFEKQKNAPIYTETTSSDRYDIFLSGATPIISIENPNARNRQRIIIV